ncbi:MAG: hypothetical protein PF517_03980 [Salinivirgaceae bacterium]|jgi:hypothetical protein|nr:hypothetical protein [Salinivirgaceae bacterium]
MKVIILITLLLGNLYSFGQCTNFHQQNCDLPLDWSYEFDSQSMSTGIFPGQTFRIKAILYEGNDYFLGICKQADIGSFQFKVTLGDIEIDQNSAIEENENLQYFELTIQKTIVAIIEVRLAKTQNMSFDASNLKCLGIIIGNKVLNESY